MIFLTFLNIVDEGGYSYGLYENPNDSGAINRALRIPTKRCAPTECKNLHVESSLPLQRHIDTKPRYCHRQNARMYMRFRGGGAAPCSPCDTRAIPSELRTMGVYYPKRFLCF
jgi:hypothetical protein